MSNNSFICNFIKENPENWKELMNEKNIKVKFDGKFAIFNYDITANFNDPIVQEARGIILHFPSEDIRANTPTVACWAFRKFGLWDCSYADKIDWESARVLEKIDGSIIKLWFNLESCEWQISTNGTIDAGKARTPDGETFKSLVEKAMKEQFLYTNKLDTQNTYIFEMVSKHTQVVIKYNTEAELYHLGTRNVYTGQELEEGIGIKKPHTYDFKNLDQCRNFLKEYDKYRNNTDEVDREGFVVVDKNYNRIKIKADSYLMLHHLVDNGNITNKKRITSMLLNQQITPETIINQMPRLGHIITWYVYQLELYKERARQMYDLSKRIYDEYDGDMKELTLIISKHELSWVGFMAVRTNKTFDEILQESENKCWKYLMDYKRVNIKTELDEIRQLP